MSVSHTRLGRDEVEAYLSSHLGPVQVADMHRTYPGHSRETLVVRTVDHGGFIVRVDHRGGPLVPVPLRTEYEVYRRLWTSPIPVAEPLWYAQDVDFAGGAPHMVRRLVAGSAHVPGLMHPGLEGATLRRQVAHEVAEKLALVHTLDWRAHGLHEVLDEPVSADDALGDDIRTWRDLFAGTRSDPFPVLTEALYWLEEQRPAGTGRVCLTKGNNGVGEEIFVDGRIVALSDWELAALGDPVLDWAFSQGLLALHDLDDTLTHYAAHAGFAIDRGALAWSTVWIRVKASITTNLGVTAYVDRGDHRSVLPALGMGLVRSTEAWLAGALGGDVVAIGEQMLAAMRSPYVAADEEEAG